MNLQDIFERDSNYIMPTYSRYKIAIVSGRGAVAVDVNGREYIDFGSGIGVNSLGYCDEGWTNAVSKQAATLQHTSNLYYSLPQLKVAEKLCASSELDKVLFCNSGAEANECAIKLARKYSFDKYGKGRNEIVSLKNSFHGRTVTTLSATGQDVFHNYFFPFTEGFKYANADDFDDIISKIGDKTCAVMIELIQGEGGVFPLNTALVLQLSELCKKWDIQLICDEVQTGIGRTGKMFAFQNYGIIPDIVTLAKGLGGGLPIGACICKSHLAEVLSAGTHGTTFGGNPVVCAGADYVLDTINNADFLHSVEKKGLYIKSRLKEMNGVTEVRGLGMMIGAILKKDNASDVVAKCLENGLIVLTAKTVLRLLPPLNITYEELDTGLNILENTLKEIYPVK